jgi:hypothetical protein
MKTKIELGIHVSHHQKTQENNVPWRRSTLNTVESKLTFLNTASFEYATKAEGSNHE